MTAEIEQRKRARWEVLADEVHEHLHAAARAQLAFMREVKDECKPGTTHSVEIMAERNVKATVSVHFVDARQRTE